MILDWVATNWLLGLPPTKLIFLKPWWFRYTYPPPPQPYYPMLLFDLYVKYHDFPLLYPQIANMYSPKFHSVFLSCNNNFSNFDKTIFHEWMLRCKSSLSVVINKFPWRWFFCSGISIWGNHVWYWHVHTIKTYNLLWKCISCLIYYNVCSNTTA